MIMEYGHQPFQHDSPYTVSGIVLHEWRQVAMAEAIAHQIPPSEVDWLLQAVSSLDRLALRLQSFQTNPAIPLTIDFEDLQGRWQQRIEARSPLQYLVGHTQWRQFRLTVSPAVLIPRPETELLIDLAIAATATQPHLRQGHWVDLGTGSGAIALGLAAALPAATVHGVDCSTEALAIAQQNAQDNELSRIQFHHGSWFTPFQPIHPSNSPFSSNTTLRFNGIVSNPPYIPSDMVPTLQPEVADHEPHLALDGGNDGLDCIRTLITIAPHYLAPNGLLLIEMMAGQANAVIELLEQQGSYKHIECHADLAGIQRFVLAQRFDIAEQMGSGLTCP